MLDDEFELILDPNNNPYADDSSNYGVVADTDAATASQVAEELAPEGSQRSTVGDETTLEIRQVLSAMVTAKNKVKAEKPLIHSIMSHIAINDCANVVLAMGANTIMAEHPMEVAEITANAKALTVTLANIVDNRVEAMKISGQTAHDAGIKMSFDVVGVTCSSYRMQLAKEFIEMNRPDIIKGNISEIKALAGASYAISGVDASEDDLIDVDDRASLDRADEIARNYAYTVGATVLITGSIDIISDGQRTYHVYNGTPNMGRVTGTGCMLNCLCGVYLSCAEPVIAALTACAALGIAGQVAEDKMKIVEKNRNISLWDLSQARPEEQKEEIAAEETLPLNGATAGMDDFGGFDVTAEFGMGLNTQPDDAANFGVINKEAAMEVENKVDDTDAGGEDIGYEKDSKLEYKINSKEVASVGLGSFHMSMIDALSLMTDVELQESALIEKA